jgi:phosphatidylserine/phosphatidylglycerophosphate/cardiolipin synthase-like enzyme
MTKVLLNLSTVDLLAIAAALRAGRLSPPYTPGRLHSVLTRSAADTVAPAMQQLAEQGFSPEQIAATADLIAFDRQTHRRLEDELEVVTTGPDARGITNRDTSVVVRELFANAESSVLVAGYAVYQGQWVFQSLAERMCERPRLIVRIFLDIQRDLGDSTLASELVMRFANRFREQQWPANRPLPMLYFDPRSLELSAPQRACLHAKCVAVDEKQVFVSSANFTRAAQERNIEVGLLVSSQSTAIRLVSFFDALISEGFLVQVPLSDPK